MNFGLIEALEKVLAKPAEELNDKLGTLIDRLELIAAQQIRTNELLAKVVEQTKPVGDAIPARPRTKAGKVSTQ